VSEYLRLVRPRIVAMVLFAMAVAAYATPDAAAPWHDVLHALLGTALVIAGAMALNQRIERRGDASMARTAARPLPAGRLRGGQVTGFGLVLTAAGLGWLVAFSNASVTGLAALSWAVYVLVYTPLKSRSAWQTPVGAAAGAMPVLLGAAAAGALGSPTAAALFGIVFFWQLPHSMAIARLYREQFAAAGVKLATTTDPTGAAAGRIALLGAAALLGVSLVPLTFGRAGGVYLAVALVLGAAYLAAAGRFLVARDERSARWLLRASLVYLPAVLLALLA
jgi:heme o synthase